MTTRWSILEISTNFDQISIELSRPGSVMGKNKRQPRDEALIKAASLLIGEDVDLDQIPDGKNKEEFLELASLAIHHSINSLQKARLEVLVKRMEEMWELYLNRDEIARQKAEAQALREKRDKTRKMLKKKTKRGQPNLRNRAKVQLQQVQEMIAKEQASK